MGAEFRYPPQACSDQPDVQKRSQLPEAIGRQWGMGPTGQIIKDFVEFQGLVELISQVLGSITG